MSTLLNSNRPQKRLPSHRTLGCPMVRGKATWCRRLCSPHKGLGVCGRLAPHAMKDRRQKAIARQKEQEARAQGEG